VKLTRSGSTITAFESSDGSTWIPVGTETFSMPSTVLVGLAVSSHVTGVTSTAAFDGVTVSSAAPPPPPPPPPPPSLPSGWTDADIGAVSAAGTANSDGSIFNVTGRGADIWGTADAFNYTYRTISGDATIVARVASVQNADVWTKAGVMIRETLNAGSTHALALVSAGKGVKFQRRPTTGGDSLSTSGTLATAPHWVKLTRVGDLFSAYESDDGSTWSLIGTETIPMSAEVLIGFAVTSHTTASSASASFDSVDIQ
jgi:regulation of enolase protein 1 (concanavalin A-like superfamily)